jgi:hypothetical protein
MAFVNIGEHWKNERGAGVWVVDKLGATQARMRNVKTRRTKWVRFSVMAQTWTHVPSTPPAQPSALERAMDAIRPHVLFESGAVVRAALDSLVSEVREEERKACIDDAETIRIECKRNSQQAKEGKYIDAWHDAAAGAQRVEDRIRSRKG